MTKQITSAIVRIRDASDQIAGPGFLTQGRAGLLDEGRRAKLGEDWGRFFCPIPPRLLEKPPGSCYYYVVLTSCVK